MGELPITAANCECVWSGRRVGGPRKTRAERATLVVATWLIDWPACRDGYG